MKKLQRNFTTPEQSKRLIELGVPKYSADMWYVGSLGASGKYDPFPSFSYHFDGVIYERDLPCWSFGRLVEIYEICFGAYFGYRYFGHTLMEDVLLKIEEQIDSIDFSKLEG